MPSKALLTKHLDTIGVKINGPAPTDVRVHDKRLYLRLLFDPSLALGEGYMKGWWDCERLDDLFFRACRQNLDNQFSFSWQTALHSLINRLINFQTPTRSQEVAEKHYNLGNQFYRSMLGETMAYTCAYWQNAASLDEAQYNKFDLICQKLHLQSGERVLDLGCGWGTLAKYMAEKYGCEVVAVNISSEQIHYARNICKGLPVQFFQSDYRDSAAYNPEGRQFDKIASIGLCEHIGHKNYAPFIQLARKQLKEDGLFLLHTIGKNDSIPICDRWINKYIFPNGILPSVKLLAHAIEGSFVIEDLHNFGADYDKTLMAWYHNFKNNWQESTNEDRDAYFYKLWSYYLLSCAGAFRARAMELWQFVLSPKGVIGGYQNVR
jgi:cyclopropane-fatty-acyl-phospholipid synthase